MFETSKQIGVFEMNGRKVIDNEAYALYEDGTEEFLHNGFTHRVDGPALINGKGKYWMQMNLLHREDGPAVELTTGEKFYYLHGMEMTRQQFRNEMRNRAA